MGYMRFHRSKQIFPGFRLNISKSGGSVSIGPKGARLNISPKGVRTTVGIPGSGLSIINQKSWNAMGAAGKPVARRGRLPHMTLQTGPQPASEAVPAALQGIFDLTPALGEKIVRKLLREGDLQTLLMTRPAFVQGAATLDPQIAKAWVEMYDAAIEKKLGAAQGAGTFWAIWKAMVAICVLGIGAIICITLCIFLFALISG